MFKYIELEIWAENWTHFRIYTFAASGDLENDSPQIYAVGRWRCRHGAWHAAYTANGAGVRAV